MGVCFVNTLFPKHYVQEEKIRLGVVRLILIDIMGWFGVATGARILVWYYKGQPLTVLIGTLHQTHNQTRLNEKSSYTQHVIFSLESLINNKNRLLMKNKKNKSLD